MVINTKIKNLPVLVTKAQAEVYGISEIYKLGGGNAIQGTIYQLNLAANNNSTMVSVGF